MKIRTILFGSIAFFFSGCFAPVNLTFESSRTLNKGELDIQGNFSRYSEQESVNTLETQRTIWRNLNANWGFKIGYGINDKYTLKARYESFVLDPDYKFSLFACCRVYELLSINYYEIENKFQLKNPAIAFSLPFAYYSFSSYRTAQDGLFVIDPRLYVTFFGGSEIFELNVIPKIHLLMGHGVGAMPAISIGMGFSSDLSKWAIRPEIGYDGYLSFGIGLNVILANLRKQG